jgi:hypothetical protein
MERSMRKTTAIVRLIREILSLGIELSTLVLMVMEIVGKATNWPLLWTSTFSSRSAAMAK